MQVKQMTNSKGLPVRNQFIIYTKEATYFQSYETIIVKTCFVDGVRRVFLDKDAWNYSKTTSKYRNLFLGEDTRVVKDKIKQGIYKLIDLNENNDDGTGCIFDHEHGNGSRCEYHSL